MKAQTKILVVEDDPSIRFGLQEVFAAEGFAVAVCERGDQAEAAMGASCPTSSSWTSCSRDGTDSRSAGICGGGTAGFPFSC